MPDNKRDEALEYHSGGRPGKIEVVPSKPTATQRDLSLAYTPGVAIPCLEIAANPADVYKYTAKGNLVAVITNGTAVLGLGDIGAAAGKPVMEGKGVLFKRFADIDVFDIEIDTKDTEEFIRCVKLLEPTFGGINLEDIAAPECFEIEERLKALMKIPVFHDDQHGTAIISAAALVNALEVANKKIEDVRIVISGAGAAAMACLRLYIKLGLRKENVLLVDRHGVIWKGRSADMTSYKEEFAAETDRRTMSDAFKDADVFIGLSAGGIVSQDMIKAMAPDPIVFAMANPTPEIGYEEAVAARPDVIMATGRSDYPNQVNNVLGFPFIFRGALDCRATTINDEMKLAASQALANLAKQDVPDSVLRAYGQDRMSFGREYLIPKPFDYRVLLTVPVAVARAAAETGVAQEPIEDYDAYRRKLENMLGRSRGLMHELYGRARQNPKRIVFPEGDQEKIVRAAKILIDEKLAHPILLTHHEDVRYLLNKYNIDESKITIIDINKSHDYDRYVERFHEMRHRHGITMADAHRILNSRNYYAMMMLDAGDADGVIAGLRAYYPATLKPALQIAKTRPGVKHVSGAYLLMFKNRSIVLADTTVNIDPDSETLAEIAEQTAETAKRFNLEPRIAMVSFSNFGSTQHDVTTKVRDAVQILQKRRPDLIVEGEMQADTAVTPEIAEQDYPWSSIKGDANVLVFANLDAANAAYKLLWRLGGAEVIGPILQGISKPVHVLQRGVDVNDIVNMAVIAVLDAQELERRSAE
ncbi:MAG TPA: NADP-dependent malic enzyme [Thermoanaerobaculia bacterium]|jgi:malate dehydrogenase (oxaloacetate-decarboxylating)(NADP+)|nr:NADP-dependent malic enzyme [Thermoanaerobaculia bacterium]